jgi:hypothetical protein
MPDEELTSQIATPFPERGTPNLRIFSISTNYIRFSEEMPTHRDIMGHILDHFSGNQILQHLHTFHWNTGEIPVDSTRIALLLRCLSNARVLDLQFEQYELDIDSNHLPIHMPKLVELTMKPITWLARVEAPNLIHLNRPLFAFDDDSATLHLSEHFGGKISHLVVDAGMASAFSKAYSEGVGPKFESLRTLRFPGYSTLEWVAHLSSIRTIDFFYLSIGSMLDSLLLVLLRHPGALPNLSIIKCNGFPSWELLFEVLRRRNAAQMHRLQELVLPSFPIFAILSRVIKLLQGHTNVYTNRDIDEVIYQRRLHQSLYV